MKRVALPFLVLAGLVLLLVGLWRASSGAREQDTDTSSGVSEPDVDPHVSSEEVSPENSTARRNDRPGTSGPTATGNAEGMTGFAAEDQLPERLNEAPAETSSAETSSAETSSAETSSDQVPIEGRTPLKRYADHDALALRRAHQIELVMQAQQQARESLANAERSGDTEVVTRTRAVIRRLQVRLDALEAAASAVEPY